MCAAKKVADYTRFPKLFRNLATLTRAEATANSVPARAY
jgi:hypothetical protein